MPVLGEAVPVLLTPRDHQVARLLVEGRTNRQIAVVLRLSERTVEWYVARLRAKLGLATRTQVAVWAVQRGLTSDADVPLSAAAPEAKM
jgi:non-specific serine/threonine protein kinase